MSNSSSHYRQECRDTPHQYPCTVPLAVDDSRSVGNLEVVGIVAAVAIRGAGEGIVDIGVVGVVVGLVIEVGTEGCLGEVGCGRMKICCLLLCR